MSVATGLDVAQLRQAWRECSAYAAWAFPSDWYTPAIDALCESLGAAVGNRADIEAAAWRLGRERARAAVCLAETLRDVDMLGELIALPTAVTRSVALGWADGCAGAPDGVVDALTGLTSPGYLAVRAAEVFRAAEFEGSSAAETHALVLVRLPGSDSPPWARDLPMILVADALRTVFAAGETLTRVGPSVAGVLARRTPILGRRVRMATELMTGTMVSTGQRDLAPQVWIERLPPAVDTLPRLLHDLAR